MRPLVQLLLGVQRALQETTRILPVKLDSAMHT